MFEFYVFIHSKYVYGFTKIGESFAVLATFFCLLPYEIDLLVR